MLSAPPRESDLTSLASVSPLQEGDTRTSLQGGLCEDTGRGCTRPGTRCALVTALCHLRPHEPVSTRPPPTSQGVPCTHFMPNFTFLFSTIRSQMYFTDRYRSSLMSYPLTLSKRCVSELLKQRARGRSCTAHSSTKVWGVRGAFKEV